MSVYVPNSSELALLHRILDVGNCVAHLFVNNYVPVEGSALANFTEMSTLGYASITLDYTLWTFGTNLAGKAEAVSPQQQWLFTEGTLVTVYGYFVTSADNLTLLWCERYGTPHPVQYLGDRILQTFKFSLSTGA